MSFVLLIGWQAASWDCRRVKKTTERDRFVYSYLVVRNLQSRGLVIEKRRHFEVVAHYFTIDFGLLLVPLPLLLLIILLVSMRYAALGICRICVPFLRYDVNHNAKEHKTLIGMVA